jgi:Mg2+ and Co2+ transporter CorA
MPEGTVTSASLTEARQLLATGSFVAVDVEQPERPTPDDQGVARQLGLDAERLAWFGRLAEDVRAEYDGEIAGFVVPVVEGDRVAHVHAVATERYLVTAHRGPVGLIETLVGRVPHDRPTDPMAALFLLLESAVGTFRRMARRVVQEAADLEDEMFEHRRQQQLHRLVLLRRHLALLHRTVLPYVEATEEFVTRMAVRHDIADDRKALVQSHDRDVRFILTSIESLQDTTQHAVESYSSLVATEQNSVIHRLTVVATIFLPLTFLTGFFGMNFAYLLRALEGPVAFWLLGMGLQVASLAVALYVAGRMGLWRILRGDPFLGSRYGSRID